MFIGSSPSDGFITASQWIEESLGEQAGDLLLQMDIEGYEYEVLAEVSSDLIERFRVIVVEFHDLHALLRGSSTGFRRISDAFRKLLISHRCVHIHPNNVSSCLRFRDLTVPDVMEFTFARRDLVKDGEFVTAFPHSLDTANLDGAELVLPRCWFGE